MATTQAVAEATQQEHENQLVTFYLGNEEFGFDIMSVQEIIRQPALSRIPLAPDYVEGIANLRGTILPIIDTRVRFGMTRQEETDSTRVLVVDVGGVKTGLRVDRVRQVTRIQSSDVEPPPPAIRAGMSSEYLKSVVKLEGGRRIILALSPGAVSKVDHTHQGAATPQATQPMRDQLERPPSASGESENDASVAQIVSFRLGREEFAFPMEYVREILRVERPSEVPDTPESVLGILTVRGNILPVIDLRTLLGLPALASELQGACLRVRQDYERWLTSAEEYVRGSAEPNPGSAGPDILRTWIANFNTSSEALTERLNAARATNDGVVRAWQQMGELREPGLRIGHFQRTIKPHADRALEQLCMLETEIVGNVQDDQRLIVVQDDSSLCALVVDKVREVLRVPTHLIGAPPRLGGGAAGKSRMRGVARLEEGRRLIMLLSVEDLLNDEGIDRAKQAAEEAMSTKTAERTEPERQQPSGGAEQTVERQFVIFRLAEGEFGIPISEIQEIERLSKATRIPTSADYVDGVTNLRGEVVPVINARKRLHLPPKEADERARVIMIDVRGKKTGLLVDSVREVLNLRHDAIAPTPDSIRPQIEPQYIAGIGQVDEGRRMIVLLNAARVVNCDG